MSINTEHKRNNPVNFRVKCQLDRAAELSQFGGQVWSVAAESGGQVLSRRLSWAAY